MPKKNNEFVILGSIIVGLFVLLGVTNVDFSSFIEEAEATHDEEYPDSEYPITTRYADYEETEVTEKRHITKMGLPTHILNNEGKYIANLYYDNNEGFELESGTISYYFDKNSCALSMFNSGRIDNSSAPLIKSNNWVAKYALNGTDDWFDVPQNDLPCTVSYTNIGDSIIINSTKSDVNGTLTEIWSYNKYEGLDQSVYFTNNNPSWTNHKFSFSHILQEVPTSFQINTVDDQDNLSFKLDRYSLFPLQPLEFGGNGTVILLSSTTTSITYTRNDFFVDFNVTDPNFNGTDTQWQITEGFDLLYRFASNYTRHFNYDFGTSFDDLWAIKFVAQQDGTLDTWVDYANVNQTTPVGSTWSMQTPVIDTFTNFDVTRLVTVFPPQSASFQGCHKSNALLASKSTVFEVGYAGSLASFTPESCRIPIMRFDISVIPDDAVPLRGTLTVNNTAGSFTVNSINGFPVNKNSRWLSIIGEDLAFFPPEAIFAAIMSPNNDGDHIVHVDGVTTSTQFSTGSYTTGFGLDTATVLEGSSDFAGRVGHEKGDFEIYLESGDNFYQLANCPQFFNSIGCSLQTSFGFGGTGGTASGSFSKTNSFFEVEWELFGVPTEPLNVVCTSASPTSVLVDFDFPASDGGRQVTGFQIERNSGAGFNLLVADTGSVFPTSFTDTTITAGVAFTYRIAAINAEGIGTVSADSNSCGVPEAASAPLSLVAANAALNVVGLNWDLPFFEGNTPITGYKINRTFGVVPLEPTAVWQLREQQVIGGAPTFFVFSFTPDRLEVDDIGALLSAGQAYVFKTFPKEDIQNKVLDVLWSGATTTGAFNLNNIYVIDGAYDRTSFTDFPSPAGLFATKGGGILHTLSRSATYVNVTDSIFLTLAGSVLDDVTILITEFDSFAARQPIMDVAEIEIVGYNKWTWDSGSSVNMEVTGGDDDFGTTTAGSSVFDVNGVNEFFTLVADTGTTLREFLDSTVKVDTTYGYRVAAINAEGTSPFSNAAIVLTVGLPDPPSNVNAVATGTTTITVSWTAPNVGSAVVQGYQIDRKIGVGGIFQTIQPFTGNDDTTFDDFLLASGTEYCYKLKTFTNIGQSTTFSDEACATTQAQADPPQNLVATALDGSTINVTWDTPANDGGSAITGYKIERQKQALAFEILFTERQPESNRVFLDTGREVGTQYTYRISAITGFGEGVSELATATTDATPQVPQNFVCSPASSTAINLSWTTPLSFSAPTGYQIDRKLFGDGGFSTIVADTATTATTFQDQGLALDTKFVYRILAHTAEGDTDFTDEINCSTLTAPDFPPENLRGDFSEVIPHQTVLAWDIPDTFGIPITEFRIERDDGAGFVEIASVSGSSIAFIDQQVDNEIANSYQVITVGTEGESVPSIAVPFDTNQTSHWHYENTIDDTGFNKNTGSVFGTANFNGTGHVGKGFIFDAQTRIEVDPTQESDYDFDRLTDFGITSYYRGSPKVAEDEWQLREQFSTTPQKALCRSFSQITWKIPPVPLTTSMGGTSAVGYCHIFKVFDKPDIIGKNVTVSWNGFRNFFNTEQSFRLLVLDGSYDRNTASDFPVDPSGEGFSNPLKGAGLLHSVTRGSPSFNVTDTVLMTLAGSTEPKITVAVSVFDSFTTTDTFLNLFELEIEGFETYTWDSNASVTMAVPVGTGNDKGVTGASITGASLSIEQVIVSKAQLLNSTGYKFFIDSTGKPSVKLTNTDTSDEIFVQASTIVTDDVLHFIGFGYNGNGTASGIFMNIDGSSVTPTIITDTLTGSILNNEALNIGGTSTGTSFLAGTIDETRIFGSGSLDEDQLNEVGNDELETTAPINATMTISGSTFANISGEVVVINMTSGFPLPVIGSITLDNFTATQVNAVVPVGTIDPITGQFVFDRFFNIMGSLSNYTADTTLTNALQAFPLLSNFDLQSPVFTFTGDFFFQQARNPTFDVLSFNFTQTIQPFDLTCNLKSTLFGNGTTFEFTNVFFIQELFDVDPFLDVVVACIDPSTPPVDLTAPSFGGSNALLSFVSFGDTTGIGNFLNFTENFGDFFGAGLPFLFIIILAAAFTGRSAPTGIIIIGVALGIMWFLGIIEQDPIMWGIIIVLIVLGALAGKKFL